MAANLLGVDRVNFLSILTDFDLEMIDLPEK
jgi:hypothetical protein